MHEKRLKKLKETKEEKMLKNKKRNNINSTSCNNSSTFNIGGNKYKPDNG